MWWFIISLAAGAVTPEQLESRLNEVAPLRSERNTQPPVITDIEYRQAASGKVPTGMKAVAGHSFKKGYGVRVVELPIAKVWAALNDDAGKLKHTKLSYAEVLQGNSCQSGRVVFQYLPLPMVSDRWWVSRFEYNSALASKTNGRVREMSWKSFDGASMMTSTAQTWSEKGIGVNFNEGSWFLVDVDGQSTLIEYYAWSDPSGYIPASITNSLALGGIRNTIDAVRIVAEEGPACPVQ